MTSRVGKGQARKRVKRDPDASPVEIRKASTGEVIARQPAYDEQALERVVKAGRRAQRDTTPHRQPGYT